MMAYAGRARAFPLPDMPEIGLVRIAGIALQVSQAALPRYRSKFSKRQFTQPQLLAVLCLMRYEDWTFREAEVRLTEHRELRHALQLASVPDYTTLYRFLKRLNPEEISHVLDETVRRMGGKRRGRTVALDATGLTKNRISSYFIHRSEEFSGQPASRRHWLKWLAVVDVDRQLILAQDARQGPWNDCASLPRLVHRATQCVRVQRVLADAEFDSERNHAFVREQLNAESIIPAKRRSSRTASGVRALMRAEFPRHQYCRRSLIETIFSTVKRKLSGRAPGHSLHTQTRQALLLGLTFNLYRLKPPLRRP